MRWIFAFIVFAVIRAPAAAQIDPDAWPNTLPRDAAGFTVVEPHAESRVVYVSSSTGDDGNDGLSAETPMRSLKRAIWKVRPYSSDQLLLRAGDVFQGGFGVWNRSGRSAEHPLLIGAYGKGDRPTIETTGEGFMQLDAARMNHVVIQGLRATAVRRDPNSASFDPQRIPYKESGLRIEATGRNILIEDCVFDHYSFNLVLQTPRDRPAMTNVTLRRSIVTNAWNHWDGDRGGHSSGIYADHVHGITVDECVFDHNGWNETIAGGDATKFNHNLYIQKNCKDITVVGSIIARAAAHGLQMRPGGWAENNLFWSCPMGMFTPSGAMLGNVVVDGRDISQEKQGGRGQGLNVQRSLESPVVRVERNLVARQGGRATWMGALNIDGPDKGLPGARASFAGNVVFDWEPAVVRPERIVGENDTRVLEALPGLDDVHPGGFPGLVEAAASRPRGTWDSAIAAEGANRYLRNTADLNEH